MCSSVGTIWSDSRTLRHRQLTTRQIAHRLSTVLEADYVTVLNDGTVIEEGSAIGLSEGNTVFRGLLEAQNMDMDTKKPELLPVSRIDGKKGIPRFKTPLETPSSRRSMCTH